jgi:23S rRNA (cytosine1962-C5)-methyltransferase
MTAATPSAETALRLEADAAEKVRRGHPWIWRRGGDVAGSGEVVRLEDGRGQLILGRGIYDAGSPIAARVWTVGADPLDDALVRERLARAFALRATLFADGATTAYRLLNGEGDRTPGWVIDRYGEIAIVRTDGDGARVHLERHAALLEKALRGSGITSAMLRVPSRTSRGAAPERVELFGPPPPAVVQVREHGVPFEVDLGAGQKTGAFLDQRENRRRVGHLGAGKRVLNLFSYAGGFSLHAALAGATTTSVDIASHAHKTAQASFKLAGVEPRGHAFVAADAFAFLEDARKKGKRWDLVVSDPPSFAPSEKNKSRALAAYRQLHKACAGVLEDGGTFCASSCSSHVTADDFADTLDDAALGRSDLRLLEMHGDPADHPTLAGFPEGRYLKFFVLA